MGEWGLEWRGGEVVFKSGRRDVGVPGGWSGKWGCCLIGEWIGVY